MLTRSSFKLLLLSCFLIFVGPILWFVFIFWRMHNVIDTKQQQLIYQTNLVAVRNAARAMLANKVVYAKEQYGRNDPLLPPTIARLQPSYVLLRRAQGDSWVHIEFGGGGFHYGYEIYPTTAKPDEYGHMFNSKKIIDGLLFYTEDSTFPTKK